MVSGFTLEKQGLHVVPPYRGLLFSKKLNMILLRRRTRKCPDSPVHTLSDSLQINFFHFGERIEKYPDSLPNLPDACGRKPYTEKIKGLFEATTILHDEVHASV